MNDGLACGDDRQFNVPVSNEDKPQSSTTTKGEPTQAILGTKLRGVCTEWRQGDKSFRVEGDPKVSGLDHKNKGGEGCFGAEMMSSFTEPVEMRYL